MDPEYGQLSREARMRRVGELCSKAVTLFLLNRMETEEAAARSALDRRVSPCPHNATGMPLPDDAKAIMDYLRRVGPASPAEICGYTELSRTTVTRRLNDLQRLGFISKAGRTTAVRYTMVNGRNATLAIRGGASGRSCDAIERASGPASIVSGEHQLAQVGG